MGRSCKLRQSVRGAKRPLSRGSRRKTSVFCPPLFPLHRRLRRGDRGGRGITPTIVTEVRSTPVREDSVQVGYVRGLSSFENNHPWLGLHTRPPRGGGSWRVYYPFRTVRSYRSDPSEISDLTRFHCNTHEIETDQEICPLPQGRGPRLSTPYPQGRVGQRDVYRPHHPSRLLYMHSSDLGYPIQR